jgi:DNA-binding NtrC family response regulator
VSAILCVDDEPTVGVVLEHALAEIGHSPVLTGSVDEAIRAVTSQPFDLIISDYRLRNGTGLDLLRLLREQGYAIPVIIMTGYASVENAVLSMKHGAVDYLTKPLRAEALRLAVNNAIELDRLRRLNQSFRQEIDALRPARAIIGESAALLAAMDTINAVAPTRASVLLQGESGTGKELFARALHDKSPRKDEAFVTVNCAALPEGLVESALFGHERGAFTGALQRAQGAFERAHRGTLLLDEVSEMRLDLQPKLLRAIQEQEFERVGGHQPIKVDVRIVATSNRDLKAEADAGRFRTDLYYRLNVVPIHTPSLRERVEDIPLLVAHSIELAARNLGVRAPEIDDDAIEFLRAKPWPGNVRELVNAIERAVILNRTGRLTRDSFRSGVSEGKPASPPAAATPPASPGTALTLDAYDLRSLEAVAIQRALVATKGHRARAAELLGISERTLRNKLNTPTSAVQ